MAPESRRIAPRGQASDQRHLLSHQRCEQVNTAAMGRQAPRHASSTGQAAQLAHRQRRRPPVHRIDGPRDEHDSHGQTILRRLLMTEAFWTITSIAFFVLLAISVEKLSETY
jgi:hypothetical protein